MSEQSSAETLIECPYCRGRGFVTGITCNQGGCHDRSRECAVCLGYGEITVHYAERIADGERRRQDRIRRGLSLKKEAARLQMLPEILNDIEHGRRGWDPE